jgi:hypothetical protein
MSVAVSGCTHGVEGPATEKTKNRYHYPFLISHFKCAWIQSRTSNKNSPTRRRVHTCSLTVGELAGNAPITALFFFVLTGTQDTQLTMTKYVALALAFLVAGAVATPRPPSVGPTTPRLLNGVIFAEVAVPGDSTAGLCLTPGVPGVAMMGGTICNSSTGDILWQSINTTSSGTKCKDGWHFWPRYNHTGNPLPF